MTLHKTGLRVRGGGRKLSRSEGIQTAGERAGDERQTEALIPHRVARLQRTPRQGLRRSCFGRSTRQPPAPPRRQGWRARGRGASCARARSAPGPVRRNSAGATAAVQGVESADVTCCGGKAVASPLSQRRREAALSCPQYFNANIREHERVVRVMFVSRSGVPGAPDSLLPQRNASVTSPAKPPATGAYTRHRASSPSTPLSKPASQRGRRTSSKVGQAAPFGGRGLPSAPRVPLGTGT